MGRNLAQPTRCTNIHSTASTSYTHMMYAVPAYCRCQCVTHAHHAHLCITQYLCAYCMCHPMHNMQTRTCVCTVCATPCTTSKPAMYYAVQHSTCILYVSPHAHMCQVRQVVCILSVPPLAHMCQVIRYLHTVHTVCAIPCTPVLPVSSSPPYVPYAHHGYI